MKINYRPEIDGLRAIAVVLVIIYHAEIIISDYVLFRGGFIGVDIFFVISGYLITSIIFKELLHTDNFLFKRFYERRIRRLFPVFIFIILATIPISWLYLTPLAFVDFSKSVLYSIGFTSNLYFYFSGQEYAALSGFYKPFLHTWSLSVEEQYYLLFPFIFFLIFKFFKKYLIAIIIFLFIISLVFADFGSRNFNSLNFYILPSRIWELLFGSIIFYLEFKKKIPRIKILNLTLPLVGIILIGWSALYFNHNLRHPSLYTLIPVFGAGIIICFSNKDDIFNKLLSTKIFVGTGLISYSLYLWHYPIFAFGRITEITSGNLTKKIILGLIILILSIFSYFIIEKPFRNRKYSTNKILFFLATASIVSIFFYSIVIINDGFKNRMPKILQNVTIEETHKKIKNIENEECLGLKEGCIFNSQSDKKIYIIGDSHAASLAYDLKKRFIDSDYQFITFMLGDCGFFPGFNLTELKSNKIDRNCNSDYFKKLKNELLANKESIIIFTSRLPLYLENKEFDSKNVQNGKKWKKIYVSNNKSETLKESFNKTINKLSKNNKILLVYPIPEFDINIPKKLFNRYLRGELDFKNVKKDNFISISYNIYKSRTKSSFELLDSYKHKNILRVYPHKLFCNKNLKDRCISHDANNIYYYDNNHLSIKGAEMVNNLIINELNKINF